MTRLKNSKILNEIELTIFCNELNSPRICWLDENQFHNVVTQLLQEISLLTGADVYDTPYKNEMLAKTIETLIATNPGMQKLTLSELRHAFYLNHNGVYEKVHTMYGKPISADYVGNVLKDYLIFKLRPISKQIEIQNLINPPQAKPIPVYTDDDYKKFIQEDYENYKKGDTEFIFLIEEKYQLMFKLGYIIYPNEEFKQKWMDYALKRREIEVKNTIASNIAQRNQKLKGIAMYDLIKETNIVPEDEQKSVELYMHKLVYFRMFEHMKNEGVGKIFDEISHTKYDPHLGIYFEPKDTEGDVDV